AEKLARIGVDQQLVRIEAVAVVRLVGSVNAIAVKLTRIDTIEIDVPDLLRAAGQGDTMDFAQPRRLEEAKLHAGGMGGEQGEVDTLAVPGRAQRKGGAVVDGEHGSAPGAGVAISGLPPAPLGLADGGEL